MANLSKSAKPAALGARDVRAISRVLAGPRRFQILKHIAALPCAACSDLRTAFPITAATLSHYLKELELLRSTSKAGAYAAGSDPYYHRNC